MCFEDCLANASSRSPFPWFYPLFFVCMIAHRASRDINRCRTKYGDAWLEYERRVPYLFIPVSSPQALVVGHYRSDTPAVRHLETHGCSRAAAAFGNFNEL